jgi:hypothetical protein
MYFSQQSLTNSAILELEHKDFTPNDRPAGDLFARAPGTDCKRCDRRITQRQAARRSGEFGWVHDVCPPAGF